MQFTAAAVLAFAASVYAGYPTSNETVSYTTEVVDVYTTYCPYATTLTYGTQTYTVSESTTLTITNCPCTVSKPITTSTYVACSTCGYKNSTAVYPTSTYAASPPPVGTASYTPSSSPSSSPIPTAGANKAIAFSGAGLAAALGVAALL